MFACRLHTHTRGLPFFIVLDHLTSSVDVPLNYRLHKTWKCLILSHTLRHASGAKMLRAVAVKKLWVQYDRQTFGLNRIQVFSSLSTYQGMNLVQKAILWKMCCILRCDRSIFFLHLCTNLPPFVSIPVSPQYFPWLARSWVWRRVFLPVGGLEGESPCLSWELWKQRSFFLPVGLKFFLFLVFIQL